jgi:hypothetical protein
MNTRDRFALGMAVLLWGVGPAGAEPVASVADFDNTSPELFSFKDDKGSVLNASTAYTDMVKGKHLGVRYEILPGGWGGCGLVLKGLNVSGYRYLAFDVRGERGGEPFEIGLRDTDKKERKRSIGQFTDLTKDWRRVLIPLSEFNGVSLSSLDNISLGFGEKQSGRVYLDNIVFEGAGSADAAGLVNKVVVDGFDRPNPTQFYRVFTGDQSSLSLVSSRILYDGDYSMEMQYQLSTNRPWGTWVSAQHTPTDIA